MAKIEWLTARPVAHRGLHDARSGTVENTPSAVRAAIAAGYAIEVDLQVSADGEAMVHHDESLERLTEGAGPLAGRTANELQQVSFKHTADRMMTLGELLDLVGSRAMLLLELKSLHDDDPRLPARVATLLQHYHGPVAAMSFDPRLVVMLRRLAPNLTRGIVAERYDPERRRADLRKRLEFAAQVVRSAPQFLAYCVRDLASPIPLTARYALGLPLLTWTVRDEEQRRRAQRHADQIIFEGFRPPISEAQSNVP